MFSTDEFAISIFFSKPLHIPVLVPWMLWISALILDCLARDLYVWRAPKGRRQDFGMDKMLQTAEELYVSTWPGKLACACNLSAAHKHLAKKVGMCCEPGSEGSMPPAEHVAPVVDAASNWQGGAELAHGQCHEAGEDRCQQPTPDQRPRPAIRQSCSKQACKPIKICVASCHMPSHVPKTRKPQGNEDKWLAGRSSQLQVPRSGIC